jgi:hypothetical protein
MHAFPLGPVERVKDQLSALFPELTWKPSNKHWIGSGPNRANDPYLDVMLTEEQSLHCYFVVLNKAPPSVMRKIMEAMQLNYACAPESGDLVDPYAYSDTDRYFAKREWSKNGL